MYKSKLFVNRKMLHFVNNIFILFWGTTQSTNYTFAEWQRQQETQCTRESATELSYPIYMSGEKAKVTHNKGK